MNAISPIVAGRMAIGLRGAGSGNTIEDELPEVRDTIAFMIALNAHFDGKVLVPDEPLALKPNQQVRITVEPIPSTPATIELGKQPGSIVNFAPDWEAPLPDDIWGFEESK